MSKLLRVIHAPWAIMPETYRELREIYATHMRGDKIDIPTVEARIGGPLEREPEGFEMHDDVAVVAVHGVVAQRMNLFSQISGGVSSQILAKQIEQLLDDDQVRAIVLDIDSPGGQVSGSQELAQIIFDGREVKPIVAHSDALIASAAYWFGSAASHVFISGDTVQAGSIGVVATHVDESKFDEKLGRTVTEISAGKYKRIASAHQPLSTEGREYIQSHVDHLYAVFVDDVARNRGVSAQTVLDKMADGRIFTGQQAIDAGLVDGVSTLDALVKSLANNDSLLSGDGVDPRQASTEILTEDSDMDLSSLTAEQLRAERPDLVLVIESACSVDVDAIAQAAASVATVAERERIQSVRAQLLPGHEALIEKLMFDGAVDGNAAAAQVLAAERTKLTERAAAMDDDAPGAQSQSEPNDDDGESPTFDALVAQAIADSDGKLTRGKAVIQVSKSHPEAHAAYIDGQRAKVIEAA